MSWPYQCHVVIAWISVFFYGYFRKKKRFEVFFCGSRREAPDFFCGFFCGFGAAKRPTFFFADFLRILIFLWISPKTIHPNCVRLSFWRPKSLQKWRNAAWERTKIPKNFLGRLAAPQNNIKPLIIIYTFVFFCGLFCGFSAAKRPTFFFADFFADGRPRSGRRFFLRISQNL